MNKRLNYISDEELEQLICQVEQEELVAAPPDLMENILAAAGLEEMRVMSEKTSLPTTKIVSVKEIAARKKEFYAYCFRVVTSVAAAVALVFLLPELSVWMEQNASPDFVQTVYKQNIPAYETVVAEVPSKDEVLAVKTIPSKEEVLNDTGLIERVISSTGWFSKESTDK